MSKQICGYDVELLDCSIAGLVYLGGGRALATAGADAQLCFWGPGDEEPHSYQVLFLPHTCPDC
jgi:hypothetical protein